MRGATRQTALIRRSGYRFQPTRPLRGATRRRETMPPKRRIFQPTRPLRGATQCEQHDELLQCISTHAPLAGRDTASSADFSRREHFNPRAPCGARLRGPGDGQARLHFNPRAPCGARPRTTRPWACRTYFNPRAPCGARPSTGPESSGSTIFQPTRPLRGATAPGLGTKQGPSRKISTHAPLAGRDGQLPGPGAGGDRISTHAPLAGRDQTIGGINQWRRRYFNPRAPCGARQQKCTNHYAHFCDNRQISDAFAQNAACQGILLLFDAGKSCGFWVRTAQVISAHLCFAL